MKVRLAFGILLFVGAAFMCFCANSFILGVACLIPACLICLGIPTRHAPHSEYYKKRTN